MAWSLTLSYLAVQVWRLQLPLTHWNFWQVLVLWCFWSGQPRGGTGEQGTQEWGALLLLPLGSDDVTSISLTPTCNALDGGCDAPKINKWCNQRERATVCCPSSEGNGHAMSISCFPVSFLKQVEQCGENYICLGFLQQKLNKINLCLPVVLTPAIYPCVYTVVCCSHVKIFIFCEIKAKHL